MERDINIFFWFPWSSWYSFWPSQIRNSRTTWNNCVLFALCVLSCSVVSACLPVSPFFWFCAVLFRVFELSECSPFASLGILLGVLLGCPCGCPPCTLNPGLHSLPTCHTLATTAKTATQVTQVYDDATDWYSEAANPWLSEKQREEVRPFYLKMGRFWLCLRGWKQHY